MNKYKLLSIIILAAILTVPGNAIFAANINGDSDDNFLVGTPGNDRISGKAGDDQLLGLGGDDILKGAEGDDRLEGDNGNDSLVGGAGADVLTGGLGNDDLHGGSGEDWLLGNAGEDFLDGGSDNDVLDGGDGDDNVKGGGGDDHVFGGKGNDLVTGSGGDDVVEGGAGNDIVSAGPGADRLSGGPGSDKLIGGLGPDEFFCGSTGESSADKNDNGTPGDVSDDFFGDIAIWDGGPTVIHDNGTPLDLSDDLQGEDSIPSLDCEVTIIADPRIGQGGAPPGGGAGEPGDLEQDPEFVSLENRMLAGVPSEIKQKDLDKLFVFLAESEVLFISNGDTDPTACASLDTFEAEVDDVNPKKLAETLRDDIKDVQLPALRTLKQC